MGRKDYDQIVLELNTKQFSIIAGKELLNRLNSYVNQELSFIYETTLSDQSKYLENTIKEMKEKEWEIILIYIWVSSLDICKERIIERAKKGGHPVPYRIIKARYTKSLDNYLNRYLPLCDNSLCFENDSFPKLVFFKDNGKISISNYPIYRIIINK